MPLISPSVPWISADRPTQQYDFTAYLLEHGAEPNSDHLIVDSTSAITAVAERGRTNFSRLLVEHGATISGSGALAAAAGNKQFAMVQWLLDQGVDVD